MRRTCLIAALTMLAGPAMAGTHAPAPPPVTILAADSRYDVAADGSYVFTYHAAFRLGSEAAAHVQAQQVVGYDPGLETLDISGAVTRKPDGSVLAVPPDSMRDEGDASADLSVLSDHRRRVVVFPDAHAGDVLEYTARRTVARALMPGAFMAQAWLPRGTPPAALSVAVLTPAGMDLHTELHGFAETVTEQAGGVLHRFVPLPGVQTPPAGGLDLLDVAPRVFVSTLPDWDALAARYGAIVLAHAAPDAAIRAQAGRLAQGAADRLEQARRIYDFVATRIRYVAIYDADGTLVPHDAAEVLARGYGDCKDHVVLLRALLAARGIVAWPVLVNMGDAATLSGPPGFAQLNHAIAWLPEFKMYADPTAATAAFGTLPFDVAGKPAVHLGGHGPAVRRTPDIAPGEAWSELATTATLDADGVITGRSALRTGGAFATELRRTAAWAQANGSVYAARAELRGAGLDGTGTLDVPDPEVLAPVAEASGSFTLEPRPDLLAGDTVAPPAGLRPVPRVGDVLLGPLGRSRLAADQPTVCHDGRQSETLTLTLPPGRQPRRLPADVHIANAALEYSSAWTLAGQDLTWTRVLVARMSGSVCQGPLRALTAAALAAIRADERTRVPLGQAVVAERGPVDKVSAAR